MMRNASLAADQYRGLAADWHFVVCRCGSRYRVVGRAVLVRREGCPRCGPDPEWRYRSAVRHLVFEVEYSGAPDRLGRRHATVRWVEPGSGLERGQVFFGFPEEIEARLPGRRVVVEAIR